MYEELEKFLNKNKGITIVELSKHIGVSRQTIYIWKEKRNIPKNKQDIVANYMEEYSKNNKSIIFDRKELLYNWRDKKSKEKKISPSLILSNKTIDLLSSVSMKTKDELLNVKGVGLNIYNQYGYEIYNLLNQENVKIGCIINFEFKYSENNLLFVNKNDEIFVNDDKLYINNYVIEKCEILYNEEKINKKEIENTKLNIVRYETSIDYYNSIIKYTIYCTEQNIINELKDKLYFYQNKYKQRIINNNSFISILEFDFKNIISYEKIGELDILLEVTKEEIDELKMYDESNSNIDKLFGLYIKYYDYMYEDLKDKLGEKITNKIDKYKGNYKYLNIILICSQNINEQLDEWLDNDYEELKKISKTVNKKGKLINILEFKTIVFTHELGHLIFSYTKSNNDLNEKRANYFVSDFFDGKYDCFINFKVQFQPYQYQNPLLKPEIDFILNNKYISDNMYDSYNKEVEALYG